MEYLYTTPSPPQPGWLVTCARQALWKLAETDRRHRGQSYRSGRGMTGFRVYWTGQPRTVPSPEHQVIEDVTLTQIWAALRSIDRETLTTLAATGSQAVAAAALGVTAAAFSNRLSKARHRFLRLWHEHETPSRLWRFDRDREVYRQMAFRRVHTRPAGVWPASPTEPFVPAAWPRRCRHNQPQQR